MPPAVLNALLPLGIDFLKNLTNIQRTPGLQDQAEIDAINAETERFIREAAASNPN